VGGVVVSKIGGWLFDAYKLKGIQQALVVANEKGLSPFIQKLNTVSSFDAKGLPLKLSEKEWSHLSDKILQPIQVMDASHFEQFYTLQKHIIQEEMAIAYGYMFIFCATAYLLAWNCIKWLVPKEKIINLP
jgi:hypothetical protein